MAETKKDKIRVYEVWLRKQSDFKYLPKEVKVVLLSDFQTYKAETEKEIMESDGRCLMKVQKISELKQQLQQKDKDWQRFHADEIHKQFNMYELKLQQKEKEIKELSEIHNVKLYEDYQFLKGKYDDLANENIELKRQHKSKMQTLIEEVFNDIEIAMTKNFHYRRKYFTRNDLMKLKEQVNKSSKQ